VQEWVDNLDACVARIRSARAARRPLSLAYLVCSRSGLTRARGLTHAQGNVVDLWERLAAETELLVELGSDQTSLHNPFGGGYFPVQLSFADATRMLHADPPRFKCAAARPGGGDG
jgi:urocanate hydratase